MSVPTLTTIGGLYRLRWDEEQVVMHLERLYEDSHYQVSCEVQINTTAAGAPSHIHGGSRLNLTSSEARRRLAKYLGEDVLPNNWTSMLEQAAVMVLAEWRKGPPTIELAKHTPREALGMRVSPLLQERQATVFYGEGDTLKSFMGLFIAVLVRSGETQAGLTPEPGNVLYLDYETDEDTMWLRTDMIVQGMGIAGIPEGIYYRYMHQPLATDSHQINRLILDLGIKLVIVDSAAPAVLEPESASMTTEYFRALRGLRTTSLTIAHVAKNAKESSPFGSTFWRNLPRANFRVIADRDSEHVTIGLKHTKSNNGHRLKDLGFIFEFDPAGDRVVISSKALTDVPSLARGLPPSEQIASALSHGALPIQEIYQLLPDITQTTISTTLSRRGDLFRQISRGVWGLVARNE